jgi:hypothetical protein
MRDPAERPRHFRTPDNKRDNFDEPSLRRRSAAGPAGGDAEDSGTARRGYLARKTLREREMEEELESRAYRSRRERAREREMQEREDEGPRTPLMVRLFAWGALLAVFFAVGYIGANYIFKRAEKRGTVTATVEAGASGDAGGKSTLAMSLGEASYKLFIPEGKNYTEREIKIAKGLSEEDMKNILTMYVNALKESKTLAPETKVLNIFRSGEWLYADMSSDFLKSLKSLGKDKSAVVISGIIKTMGENFPPVNKVKFYIDGKEHKDKNPVDLTHPWSVES